MGGGRAKVLAVLAVAIILGNAHCVTACALQTCSIPVTSHNSKSAPCHHRVPAGQPCSHTFVAAALPGLTTSITGPVTPIAAAASTRAPDSAPVASARHTPEPRQFPPGPDRYFSVRRI